MVRHGICGVALGALVAFWAMGTTTAAAHPDAGCSSTLHVGAVSAIGCWKHSGATWTGATPITLNGLTLSGGKGIVVDTRRGTITSRGSVRWTLGTVQIRKSPFAWKRGSRLKEALTGAVRGLSFLGGGTLAFTPAKGGTTTLATHVLLPLVAGGLSGDVVLTARRTGGLDLTHLHVAVPQAPLSRLVFKDLDFSYDAANARWYGSGQVSLPAFATSTPTILGHVGVANGKVVDVDVGVNGLKIPLADGFFLTGAELKAGLDPFGLAGSATVTFGPTLGSGAALQLVGRGSYVGAPQSWTASGTLTLPWLPDFTPTVEGSVSVQPGRAVTFDADVMLTIHGWGLTSHLDGFVSKTAFNAEGDASLSIPGPDLHGTGLFSSKGMAACGRLFFGPHVGFGYSWGGSLDFMHSSCDVGRWRVDQPQTHTLSAKAAPPSVSVTDAVPFEVFAAHGSDFTVTGPAGPVSSTPDRDGPDAFVTHDLTSGWAYVVLPVPPIGSYVFTPAGMTPLDEIAAGDGITDPTIGGTVTGTGVQRTLQYGIGGLVPGETVSFYEGESETTSGAQPIAEDVAANGVGSAQFAPEDLGQSSRYVYAVVSIDGRPREQVQVASFDSVETPPPVSLVRIFRDPTNTAWVVNYAQSAGVTEWQAIVQTVATNLKLDVPTRLSRTLTVPPFETSFTTDPSTPLRVLMTPYDAFGRAGDAVLCDSTGPGLCPPAPSG